MPSHIGQKLGNYRLAQRLGKGGFAEVYLGQHIHIKGMQAAIKILHAYSTDKNRDTFLQEAEIIVRLKHPHIIHLIDFGVIDETPYLIMDYMPNGTLQSRHPKGQTVPIGTVVSYVKQIAKALQYAHDLKIIHRDLKPENILIGEKNELVLSDFGISIAAHDLHSLTPQIVIGTHWYMAPEQWQGKAVLASDQYSLGVIVYEWLCGELPFTGDLAELIDKHRYILPPSLCMKNPAISPAVNQVVMKALEKNSANRYPTIQAFAFALEQALVSHIPPTIPAKPVTPKLPPRIPPVMPSPPSTVPSSPPPSLPLPQHSPRRTQKLWLKVIVTLLGIALLIGGGFAIPWSHLFNPYPYPSYMVGQGTLVDQDPLSDPNSWSFSDPSNCLVENDALHILTTYSIQSCAVSLPVPDNFALETQLNVTFSPGFTANSGDVNTYCGAIDVFTNENPANYELDVCSDGTYIVQLGTNNIYTAQGGTPKAIPLASSKKGGLGTLGVVESSSDLIFYVNQKQVADFYRTYSGTPSLYFDAEHLDGTVTSITAVDFSNLEIWD